MSADKTSAWFRMGANDFLEGRECLAGSLLADKQAAQSYLDGWRTTSRDVDAAISQLDRSISRLQPAAA